MLLRKLLFVLVALPSIAVLWAQDLAVDDLTGLGFDDAQISVAGPQAFYIRSVAVDGSYFSFRIEADASGVWRVVGLFPEDDNIVPPGVFLDLAVVTPLDATTLSIDGIVYDGEVLQGTLSLTDDAALTLAGAFRPGTLPTESLERVEGLRDILLVEEREAFEAELAERSRAYEEQIQLLQRQRTTLVAERDELRAQVDVLETVRDSLRARTAELEAEVATLTEQLEVVREDLAEAQSREAELDARNADLTERIASLEADLAAAREAAADRDVDEETARRLQQAQARIDELTEENEAYLDRIDELQSRATNLETQVTDLQSRITDLEASNENLEASNAELLNRNTELQAANVRLSQTNANLRAETESLVDRVEELSRRNETLSTEIERLEREIADLEAEDPEPVAPAPSGISEEAFASEAGEIRGEISGLSAAIGSLQGQIQALTAQVERSLEREPVAEPARTGDTSPDLPDAREDEDARVAELRTANARLREQLERLEAQNARLSEAGEDLRMRVMERLLEDGVIAAMRGRLTRVVVDDFSRAETQIGSWTVRGNTARQTDSNQYFAKLTLPAPQAARPTLYSFTARATDEGWVGIGIHIMVSDVRARGYGLGRSLLVWLTRDYEEYRSDDTYLQLYRSNDDIDMGRVLDAVIEERIDRNLDIDVLYEPENEYITIAVNGEEKIRYKTWFGVDQGIEVALRSLGAAEFRDLEIRTLP